MPVLYNEFYALAALLTIAAAAGAVGRLLRQPLIVTFIGVGILVGPSGMGLLRDSEYIELLARMGIAILLFLVGIRLDVRTIRTLGPVASATGLGQVLFTSVIGFALCLLLGYSAVASLYIAVALTFSSTIIIVKLLSDKREIDSLHGRISVGFLIVQDVVAILALILLSAFGGDSAERGLVVQTLLIGMKGAVFLAGIAVLMRWVLPPLVRWLAHSQELLVLFAVAWAMILASLGAFMGFSQEVGAFLAGVSLGSTPFRESIGSRLVPLRDFLLLFFFLKLGADLNLRLVGEQLVPAGLLSAFVLIGNPLIVMAIMGYMGYRRRTGFLAGLTVAQISEFSLVLGALGVTLGHLSQEAMALITLVGLVTIGLSTYMILYSNKLYEWLAPVLRPFERKVPYREMTPDEASRAFDVVLFGLGRYGSNIARHLREKQQSVLGVDFDPNVITEWESRGWDVMYGDAEDPELAGSLPLESARWVVCTSPTLETNLAVLHDVREYGFRGRLALTAHHHHDAHVLERAGADMILLPYADAAAEAADRLIEFDRNLPVQGTQGGSA